MWKAHIDVIDVENPRIPVRNHSTFMVGFHIYVGLQEDISSE